MSQQLVERCASAAATALRETQPLRLEVREKASNSPPATSFTFLSGINASSPPGSPPPPVRLRQLHCLLLRAQMRPPAALTAPPEAPSALAALAGASRSDAAASRSCSSSRSAFCPLLLQVCQMLLRSSELLLPSFRLLEQLVSA